MCDFVDLSTLAASYGFEARRFTPFKPAFGVERVEDLLPTDAIAVVFDRDDTTMRISAAMLLEHIAATVSENAREFASWLALAHLHCLVDDFDYPS
jgi:hypothetical protein